MYCLQKVESHPSGLMVPGTRIGPTRRWGPANGDLGRRVDLVERSIRRSQGDPELARAFQGDVTGDWD